MSYSIRAGKYVSHATGREYPFERFGQNAQASKALAKAKMEADDAKLGDASQARHGRELSLRETLHGVPQVDKRPIRAQVEANAHHHAQPDNTGQNPYSARIAELTVRHQLASRRQDKVAIEKRLAVHQAASDKWDNQLAERRNFEAMLQSAPVQKAIAHAESHLERLLHDPRTDEATIAEAKMRLMRLKESGDVESYEIAYESAEKQARSTLQARHADLEAQRQALLEEAGLGEGSNALHEGSVLKEEM